MHSIIQETAFSESFLTIEPALKNHQWPLICDDKHTPIKHTPTMPFTLIAVSYTHLDVYKRQVIDFVYHFFRNQDLSSYD